MVVLVLTLSAEECKCFIIKRFLKHVNRWGNFCRWSDSNLRSYALLSPNSELARPQKETWFTHVRNTALPPETSNVFRSGAPPDFYKYAVDKAAADLWVLTVALVSAEFAKEYIWDLHINGKDNETDSIRVFLRSQLSAFDSFSAICCLPNPLKNGHEFDDAK